ncbi:DUF3800 domain-containing protein [Celeribacter halophilus]|uniref:DUF3800 domain-containing protein n=1 Tax=Celeribacter halophilus TaxID=576117 RepID=UPI001C0987B6|nr:DUF3800 domain-containing protein [Celeribacter halophilus]MBU2891166.1 DUF3800 domain-containing protein [Celeribacter halophilus]MDO6510947.1 DUF3800 domain-containing protein [Celeribacter halophilus]
MAKYIFFIDESGDQDLERFRAGISTKGSEPFLVFGGALIVASERESLEEQLQAIQERIGKNTLHCSDLNHLQRSFYARSAKNMHFLAFGAVSKKATVGGYKREIEGPQQAEWYYNKCAQYLLERIAEFAKVNEIKPEDIRIVFEKKGKHNYEQLRNFISTIRSDPAPKYESSKVLRHIDPRMIEAVAKHDDRLLCLADLVAHAIFVSLSETKTNFGIPEQRYFREIKPKFWCDPQTGRIANWGIKFIKGPVEMELRGETMRMVNKLYKPNEALIKK